MYHLLRRPVLLCAAIAAVLMLVIACGGDDDDASPETSDTPAAGSNTAAATIAPLPTGETTCVPGDGPPAEGEAEGLEGTIVYVRLVFGCQPDVYAMDANGDGAHPLADHESIDDESDLSPDGSKVVFFSGRDGNAFLYVMNVDGSELTRLTSGGGGDTSPRWSPDGTRIAFSQSGSIVVMNADGTDPNVIMQSVPGQDAPPCRAGSFVGSWSPDGENIVYYSAIVRSNGENTFWLCTISTAGGGEPRVLIDEPGLHAEPYWSPQGDQIVFRDDDGGSCSSTSSGDCNYEIFVLDIETLEKTNVTNHPAFDIEPVWSPDGEWILFGSNREDPNFDLYVVRPDGSDLQRVLADPDSKDSYPSWR